MFTVKCYSDSAYQRVSEASKVCKSAVSAKVVFVYILASYLMAINWYLSSLSFIWVFLLPCEGISCVCCPKWK